VNYRLYALGDFEQLYAIEQLCFAPELRFSRRYMRDLTRRPNKAAWIAEENGQLAGFAVAAWAVRKAGIVAYIETIEVLPEYRSQGAGGELLRHLESSAISASACTIWLHVDAANADAIRLYQAHGYLCEGSREDFYPGGNAAFIYSKPLLSRPSL